MIKIMEEIKKKVSVLKEDFLDELYYDREELLREGAVEIRTKEIAEYVKRKIRYRTYF